MEIRSVRDLQVAARSRRLELGLTQQEVADQAAVSRKWLVGFEGGSATAVELALVLRLFAALEIPLILGETPTTEPERTQLPDLTQHLAHFAAPTEQWPSAPSRLKSNSAAQRVAEQALRSIQAAHGSTPLSPAELAAKWARSQGIGPADHATVAARAVETLKTQGADSPASPETETKK